MNASGSNRQDLWVAQKPRTPSGLKTHKARGLRKARLTINEAVPTAAPKEAPEISPKRAIVVVDKTLGWIRPVNAPALQAPRQPPPRPQKRKRQ